VGRELSGRQLRSGEKRGAAVVKPSAARERSGWYWSTARVFHWRVRLESAFPGEATLAEATLAEVRVPRAKGRPRQKPKRVVADRAYDSDPLRERLKKRRHRVDRALQKHSRHRRYEDGRKLRRYRRRWIIERTNA
jgi:hypothetical protein